MTAEQEKLWGEMNMDRKRVDNAAQSRQAQVEVAVRSFGYACQIEGIGDPDEAEVRARLGG